MSTEAVERRLAAIMSADVEGYCRLMGRDELGTIQRLAKRHAIADSYVRKYNGRIIDTAGDGFLAEFPSAVDALHSAIDMQQDIQTENEPLPHEQRMWLRIGINVGDVVVEGRQILGQGVNIAARLQTLAEAGGICISGTVFDQLDQKMSLRCESLGEQTVKNIGTPIRVYRVRLTSSTPTVDVGEHSGAASADRNHAMNVLIVDDHALIRDGLQLLLPKLDARFQPLGAGSCQEALTMLAQRSDIELVLMDLELPDATRGDGIAAVRQKFPEMPIVAMSGEKDRAVILEAIRKGAMGFIPKSYSGDQMFGALQYILVHKGTFLPAEAFVNSAPTASSVAPPRSSAEENRPRTDPRSLGLTDRQCAVLQLLLQGKPNKAIARQLGIEDPTVRAHVTAVLRALNVTTRTEAVIAAHRLGLVFAGGASPISRTPAP